MTIKMYISKLHALIGDNLKRQGTSFITIHFKPRTALKTDVFKDVDKILLVRRSRSNMCSLRDARMRPVWEVTPIELFRNINRFTMRGSRGLGRWASYFHDAGNYFQRSWEQAQSFGDLWSPAKIVKHKFKTSHLYEGKTSILFDFLNFLSLLVGSPEPL